MNNKIKIVGLTVISMVMLVTTAMAFTVTDAEKIGAISKRMAAVTTDVAVAQIKYDSLASERAVIDEKMELVQNHIDEQNKSLDSFKKEIELIIDADFTQTEK